jgi:hypothetical protein
MDANDYFKGYNGDKMRKYNAWLATPHGREVYTLFKNFAAKWREAGNEKCSASLIVNRLRWETGIKGRYYGFRVSNDHAPLLARQLMQDEPEYRDFFDMKKRHERKTATKNLFEGKELR